MPAPKGNDNAVKDPADSKTHYVHMRTTAANKGAWIRASRARGQKLSTWIEETLNARIRRETPTDDTNTDC